ncbi:MAG: hypothetical protein PHR82_09110 [Endomicrobiaceae bacterium]|nr:hypothetical protein [Endomicrobiaceae bacterium]
MVRKYKILFALMFIFSFAGSVFSQDSVPVSDQTATNNSTNSDFIDLSVPLITTSTDTVKTKETAVKTTDVRINLGAQAVYNNISGPGKASSSLSEGFKNSQNLNINVRGYQSDFKYQLSVAGRATNDERVDSIPVSLTSLQTKLEYKNNYLNVGDVFESFSQYSLNTSLKGASYKYNNQSGKTPVVSVIFGSAYPRWESWFKDAKAQSITRTAYGANIKQDITDNLKFGVTALKSDDSQRIIDTDPLYSNTLYSLDGEYSPIPGLTVTGEAAISQTELEANETATKTSYNGNAFKLEIVGDQDPSRVVLGYERVNPEFETLLGSAISDRERASARWKYKWTANTTFDTRFTWYRNSLNDASNSTNNYKPEVGINIKKIFDRRYSNLNFNVKLDQKNSSVNNTSDYFVDLGYRDRFIGLDVDAGTGFTSYNVDKNTTDTLDYSGRISVSTRKSFDKFILKPSINASSNYIDDNINNTTDKIFEYSIGLGVDLPDSKLTSNFRFGQNILKSSAGDDAESLFVNAGVYYQPSSFFGVTDCTIFTRIMMNDFAFQTDTRNFNEKSISMGISIPLNFKI